MNDGSVDNISKEVEELSTISNNNNWSSVRTINENYELIETKYSFGTRKCYKALKQKTYEDLQASRGIDVDSPEWELVVNNVKNEIVNIKEPDLVRINELTEIQNRYSISFKNRMAELGFRVPKLLKHYKEDNYDIKGYDVVDLNILIGKHLGYNVKKYDFNSDCIESLDVDDCGLIVCYHMLEHLTDPLRAIKKIYESMGNDCYLHVEVPIEQGIPRVRYGHMFAFEVHDLYHMLKMSGFEVLNTSNKTHTNPPGPHIERYLAVKK